MFVLTAPANCIPVNIWKVMLKATVTHVHACFVGKIQALERWESHVLEKLRKFGKFKAGPVGFELVGVLGASHDMLVTPKAS